MSKERSSGVIGERNSMLSTDMKYQFNNIFPLLIKKENAGKPHFGPDLGLLSPNLGYKFFLEILALLDNKHCPKLQSCAISRKTDDVMM